MDRILITGISGFVGRHFLQFLYDSGIESRILGLDKDAPTYDYSTYSERLDIDINQVNLLDIESFDKLVSGFRPDMVLHLASFSSVAYSWKNPTESFLNNSNIFFNLATVISSIEKKCRILSIGSSEEYGNVSKEDIPIKERLKLNPLSPYAVARVSQELMSKVYSDSYGMDIVMTRSFNHIGPWQDERFVVPSFIRRILTIKKQGKRKGCIKTGDISIVRDFVDVRDVVRAYWLLLNEGKSGEVYNICSGKGKTLETIIRMIADIIGVQVESEVDPAFIRPNDNRVIIGENYKIYDAVGWEPLYDLKTTLIDTVEYMSNKS